MASKLFGFSIDDENDKLSPSAVSPVPPNNEDGVDHYMSSGFFGSYVDIEGVFRSEFDLIKRYREMSLHPEVDTAPPVDRLDEDPACIRCDVEAHKPLGVPVRPSPTVHDT